jgi:hypothetical protein
MGGRTVVGVGLVAADTGSGSWQVPSFEVTSLVIAVVPDGRGLSTFTVKYTVTALGVAAVAAGTSEALGACAARAGGTAELTDAARRAAPPVLPVRSLHGAAMMSSLRLSILGAARGLAIPGANAPNTSGIPQNAE